MYKLLRAREALRSRDEARRLAAPPRHGARGRGKAERSERDAEVLRRCAAGESGVAIAQALGLTDKIVYGLLRREGVLRSHKEAAEIRAKTREKLESEMKPEPVPEGSAPTVHEIMPAELAEQALAGYAAGEPPREIGGALGVPTSRVYRLLSERGVLRSRSEARRVVHARRTVAAGE